MSFVWKESLKQTRQMLESWSSSTASGISSVAKDTRTLSLNVLAATGFHRSYDFRSSGSKETDGAGSYRDALQTVLDNAILLMLMSPWLLRLPAMPRSWARLGRAAAEFKQYMVDMLDEETSLMKRGEKGTGSLMTSLVRALGNQHNEEAAGQAKNDQKFKGLTADEIFGNIFVINFAGHDTTANTLAFSMLLLAAYPEVQDWVGEEVNAITANDQSESWDYTQIFPRLKRCRAVLVCIALLNMPIGMLNTNVMCSLKLFASIRPSWHFLNGPISTSKRFNWAIKRSLFLHIQASWPACSPFKHIPSTGRILCTGDHPDGSPTPWPQKPSFPRRLPCTPNSIRRQSSIESRVRISPGQTALKTALGPNSPKSSSSLFWRVFFGIIGLGFSRSLGKPQRKPRRERWRQPRTVIWNCS